MEYLIDITWSNSKLKRHCSTESRGQREFGSRIWPRLKTRIGILEAAPSLADLREAPGRWHALGADRGGQWAASLDANHRLIVSPNQPDPLPQLTAGGVDVSRVTGVEIVEVVDYHG